MNRKTNMSQEIPEYCLDISQDGGTLMLTFLHVDKTKTVIFFPIGVYTFKKTCQMYALGMDTEDIDSSQRKTGHSWIVYIPVERSVYCRWLIKESFGHLQEKILYHYRFYTNEEIIETISSQEPKIIDDTR